MIDELHERNYDILCSNEHCPCGFYGKEYPYHCKLAARESFDNILFCKMHFTGPKDLVDTLDDKDLSKMSIAELKTEEKKYNEIVADLHSNYAPLKHYNMEIYLELKERFPEYFEYTLEVDGRTIMQTNSKNDVWPYINTFTKDITYAVYDPDCNILEEFEKPLERRKND